MSSAARRAGAAGPLDPRGSARIDLASALPAHGRQEAPMGSLLSKIRALPDSLQNVVVLGMLLGAIGVVVLLFKVIG
jgi:hypothetical protein